MQTATKAEVQSARTPGPWHSADGNCLNSSDGKLLGYMHSSNTPGKSNAAFIVTACNAHDQLVAVLRAIIAAWDDEEERPVGAAIALARVALAKVQP